jgi:UDP-N-acetylglucosamine 2-epimerase (non-hydrolysing)
LVESEDITDRFRLEKPMRKILASCIVGARPNFMKMSSLLDEMSRRPHWQPSLVHTGQHYSPEMSQTFFEDLGLPAPDINLEVGSGTQSWQTAEVIRRIEPVWENARPDVAIVVGDVNSTVAASLTAAKMEIPLAHVEAGLRSFDRTMPEEINRLVTDVLADFLFVTEASGRENLLREGCNPAKIFMVGNTMIDTLLRFRGRAAQSDAVERLGLQPRNYAVVTMHRPSNVDDPARLMRLLEALERVAERLPVVFPMHPRTQQRIDPGWLGQTKVRITPPQNYIDFLRLMSDARLVLTDSGGIQEETTILGVPCLTMRENTERPVTITHGTNRLVGVDPEVIVEAAWQAFASEPSKARPEMWDGKAGSRILDALENHLR